MSISKEEAIKASVFGTLSPEIQVSIAFAVELNAMIYWIMFQWSNTLKPALHIC